MENFKVGDIVARRSYNYDVLFRITAINNGIADLVRYIGKNCSRFT